jgi:predicted esterase
MLEEFKSEKTFRYAKQGDISKAHTILYVLHGYGQLAEYFIRKFSALGTGYFVIAPEGMHRFYLNGTSGRVGASWMTKEARETDISDNMHWLNELDFRIENKSEKLRKVILGFSQGGATAARWFYEGKIQADQLIMWASIFPPDLTIKEEIKTKVSKGVFVVGTNDPYFQEINDKLAIDHFQQLGFTTFLFDGGHDLDENTLLNILKRNNTI